MKLNEAIELGKQSEWLEAHVRMNPADRKQWYVTLRDIHNKSFILADNDDKPIAMEDMHALARVIQSIGLVEFTVIL